MVWKVAQAKSPCKRDNFWKEFEISRLAVVKMPCRRNDFSRQSEISNRFEFTWVSCKQALRGWLHVWFHFGNPQWNKLHLLRSPHILLMLFTGSRRNEISHRSDFTLSKRQKWNLMHAWKTRVSQNIWTLTKTKVKSKIAIWYVFYEKKNIQEMVIILFLWESLFCNLFCCTLGWERWLREKKS